MQITPVGVPAGQTIFVTEGVGLCRREGGPVETIRPGDRVFVEAEQCHAPERTGTKRLLQKYGIGYRGLPGAVGASRAWRGLG